MRKLFLLFVVLCSLLTAKAADSEWSLYTWDKSGGLEKLPNKIFQTTDQPNLFVIKPGSSWNVSQNANFLIKKGETYYNNAVGVECDVWHCMSKDGGGNTWIKNLFAFNEIFLWIIEGEPYVYFQSNYKLYTWSAGAFNNLADKAFKQTDVVDISVLDIPGGATVGGGGAGDFLVETHNGTYCKKTQDASITSNSWISVAPNASNNIWIPEGTYYRLYLKTAGIESSKKMAIYASTILPTAPSAFTIIPDAKYDKDMSNNNIFLGFTATWTKVAPQPNNEITYKLTYKKDNVAKELIVGDVNTATLYGVDGGDITVSAVYKNTLSGMVETSYPATVTYEPIDVVQPVVIDTPRQLKRYGTADDSNTFSATLSWTAPATYPVSGYDIKQADATIKETLDEADYTSVFEPNMNYEYTALADIMIKGITNINEADPVKVNYIVIPKYSIGNTVMTTITDADYSKTTDLTVEKPAFADITPVTAEFTKTLIPTGVEGIEAGKAAVYPNPTTGAISITATEAINEVVLYNLSGGLVAKFNGGGESSLNIDITDTSAGTYFLKVGTSVTKIIKK